MNRPTVMVLLSLLLACGFSSSHNRPSVSEYRYCQHYRDEDIREKCMARIDRRYQRRHTEVECHKTFFGGTECESVEE